MNNKMNIEDSLRQRNKINYRCQNNNVPAFNGKYGIPFTPYMMFVVAVAAKSALLVQNWADPSLSSYSN